MVYQIQAIDKKRHREITCRLIVKVDFVCYRWAVAINTKCAWKIDVLICLGGSLEVVESFCFLGDLTSSGMKVDVLKV